MKSINNHAIGRFSLPALVICEWLMVLPPALFLAAATLRMLQPRQYEPARTSWIILDWTTTHISRFGAAILFVGLPGIVIVAGCATLLHNWQQDQTLRHDLRMIIASLRSHSLLGVLTAAVLLAGTILTAVVSHLATD
jgi:hypothetical protein